MPSQDCTQCEGAAPTPDQVAAVDGKGSRLVLVRDGFGNAQAIIWDCAARRVQAASDPRWLGRAEVH